MPKYFAIPDRGNMTVVLSEKYFSNVGYELSPRLGNAILGGGETSSNRCIYSRVGFLETNSDYQKKYTTYLVSF